MYRLKLYYHTIRYLKPIQIFGRIWFYLNKPRIATPGGFSMQWPSQWLPPARKTVNLVNPTTFWLHNRKYQITHTNDWQNPQMDKLFLYHLHYFDDLNAHDSEHRHAWHVQLINAWIDDNPAGYGIGWQPYPISLRMVNWIKWIFNKNNPTPAMIKNLFVHADYLRQCLEIHLLGNHLLANAKALLFSGLFFNQQNWVNTSLKILRRQFAEQILTDGGHFERSSLYHCIVLEDILDCINVLQAYNRPITPSWREYANKMLQWLNDMLHPDGEIALFNDATFKIAAHPTELFAYAQRLGMAEIQTRASVFFQKTGYAHLSKGNAHIFVDVAPIGPDYLPGHAHADSLTFECSLGQQRLIVNSGTSVYEKSAERLRQRGTAAHNTLIIDELNSSNIWASFRVAERARIQHVAYEEQPICTISAAHTGYLRLSGNIIHKRTWVLDEFSLQIYDEITGQGHHALKLFFHFHPDLTIEKVDRSKFQINKANTLIAEVVMDSKLISAINPSTYHPEFGISILNQKLIGEITSDMPLKLITQIHWRKSL